MKDWHIAYIGLFCALVQGASISPSGKASQQNGLPSVSVPRPGSFTRPVESTPGASNVRTSRSTSSTADLISGGPSRSTSTTPTGASQQAGSIQSSKAKSFTQDNSFLTGSVATNSRSSTRQVISQPSIEPASVATEIIIGSSSIPFPTATQIISATGTERLTIGPSGILQSGTYAPFPIGSEASIFNDFTLGLVESTVSGYPTSTSDDASVYAPVITPPPSGSPGYIPDTVPTTGRSQTGIAITLDQETYVLPFTASVELLQADGSFITLLPDAVVSGAASIAVPSAAAQTSLSSGNFHIEAGPQSTGSSASGGTSGFGGLINALKGLAGGATSLSSSLDEIAQQGASWAAGSLDDSAFANGVGSLLDSATSDLSSFVSTMSSTLDEFSAETYEMTEDGLRRIFPARTGAVEELDLLKSLRKLVKGLTNLRNDAINSAKSYWKQGTAAAAALAAAEEAIRNFGTYDWGAEIPKSSSSTSATSTSSTAVEVPPDESTSTVSTTSSTATATPAIYLLTTKEGTSLDQYQALIKSLPDAGNGIPIVFPHLSWQRYVSNLTAAQAKDVATHEIIDFVVQSHESDIGTFGALLPAANRLEKRVFGHDSLEQRRNSEDHLRLISANRASHDAIARQPDARLPNYMFDPILGQGQTIYILDSGYELSHADFGTRNGSRTVETMVAPNSLTLEMEPNQALHSPETIDDISGHGTRVASVAGGIINGVASGANLVLIKFRNSAKNPYNPTSTVARAVTETALVWAWDRVVEDVLAKREAGNTGKFIVNMSYGFPASDLDKDAVMQSALAKCWKNDIITVIPTGNDGHNGVSLDQKTPQRLGTASNALITVGGVDRRGALGSLTNYDAGRGGSISVYGDAIQVVAADSKTPPIGTTKEDGTSFASPAVAGLAAYYASLPSLADQFTAGSISMQMKQYISQNAYVRLDTPIPANFRSTYPYYAVVPPPDSIKVVYNRAPEGLCAAQAPGRRHLPDSEQDFERAMRRDSSGDLDVVVSGVVVASSLVAPYCVATSVSASASVSSLPNSDSTVPPSTETTSETLQSMSSLQSTTTTSIYSIPPPSTVGVLTGLPTLGPASYCTEVLNNCHQVLHTMTGQSCTYNTVPPSSCTATSTTSLPAATCTGPPAAPTVNRDSGILTCGTRSDQGNADYWFSLPEVNTGIREFCGNMTNQPQGITLGPGTPIHQWYGTYIPPERLNFTIKFSATFGALNESTCPTAMFPKTNTDFDASWYNRCYYRIRESVDNCDTQQNGKPFWKQGGTFFQDCIAWQISAEATWDADWCQGSAAQSPPSIMSTPAQQSPSILSAPAPFGTQGVNP